MLTNRSAVPNSKMSRKAKKKPGISRRKGSGVFVGVSGEVSFDSPELILSLMAEYGHVKRVAYRIRLVANAFGPKPFKDGDEQNWLRRQMAVKFPEMNSRYLYGAVSEALGLPLNRPVLFGGKKNWKRLLAGEISSAKWHEMRDNLLFCGGEADQSFLGNRNLVILGNDKLKVKVGKTNVEGKLRLFEELPEHARKCYSVRLKYLGDNKFSVTAGFQIPSDDIVKVDNLPGTFGLDINPDLIAAMNVCGQGNQVSRHQYEIPRAVSATQSKRDNDIRLVAISIVDDAKKARKPIVMEDLDFGSKRKCRARGKKGRRFNRMRHNFSYRAILMAIERRAMKEGVKVIHVAPDYSSIIGIAKFAKMYRLNRHMAAAMCIARRGLGIKERQNFAVTERTKKSRDSVVPQPGPSKDGGRKNCAPVKTGPSVVRLKPRSYQSLASRWLRHASGMVVNLGGKKTAAHRRQRGEGEPGRSAKMSALQKAGVIVAQPISPNASSSHKGDGYGTVPSQVVPLIGDGHADESLDVLTKQVMFES